MEINKSGSLSELQNGKHLQCIPRFHTVTTTLLVVLLLASLGPFTSCFRFPDSVILLKYVLVFISVVVAFYVFIYALKSKYLIFRSVCILLLQLFLVIITLLGITFGSTDCGGQGNGQVPLSYDLGKGQDPPFKHSAVSAPVRSITTVDTH